MKSQASRTERYVRQISLPEVGAKGQIRLSKSRVLCIGVGGLGSPVVGYLAAAGVGTIGIVDFDSVELSNLQRQIIHTEQRVGSPKTESARSFIEKLNSDVKVVPIPATLSEFNAESIFANFDLVIDGSDNFSTRYLVNDVCAILEIPLVFGSVLQFEGQVAVFNSSTGPCYRCVFPTPPMPEDSLDCAAAGIIGSVCGVIGTLMATEAIKILLGLPSNLTNQILYYSALGPEFSKVKINKKSNCLICSLSKAEKRLFDNYNYRCVNNEITTADELRILLASSKKFALIDVRTREEFSDGFIGGAINIPSENFLKDFEKLYIDSNSLVILYCQTGVRSQNCVAQLVEKIPNRVLSLKGGYINWLAMPSNFNS